MPEDNISKRGIKRTKEAIVADYDERISKHETQIAELEEKTNKSIAYHKACIETLKVKRETTLNSKKRSAPPAAELLKKIKDSGKSIEEIIAMLDANA